MLSKNTPKCWYLKAWLSVQPFIVWIHHTPLYTIHCWCLMFRKYSAASHYGRGPVVWSRGWSIHHLAAALHGLYGLYGLYDGPCSLEFISISIPDQYCDEYTLFVIWRFFQRNCYKQIVSTWYWEDLAGKGPKRSCRLSLEYCVFITVSISISSELYSSILAPLDSDPEAEVRVRGHVARRPQSRTSPGHARTRGHEDTDTARVRQTLYAALISRRKTNFYRL